MTELVQLASELQSFFEEKDWRFCFIGGFALQHWGEQRLTKDVDATLFTGFSGEEGFVDALLAEYEARRPDMREFALRNRVLLLQAKDGLPFDIALGALPYEERMVSRAVRVDFGGPSPLRICTAEDLIVLKAFAERERDWLDVETILIRQQGKIDWPYILEQLTPLAELKESPAILDRLAKLRAKQEKCG